MASHGRSPEHDDRKILPSIPERSNSTTVRNNGSRGGGGGGDVYDTKDVRSAIKADIRKSLRQAIGNGSAGDRGVESRDDVMDPPTSSSPGVGDRNRRNTTITSSVAALRSKVAAVNAAAATRAASENDDAYHTTMKTQQPIKELVFRVESELGLLPPPPPNPTSLERLHIDSPSITSTIRTTASRHTLASRHTSASRNMSASRHTTKRYSTPRPPPPSSAGDVVKSREFAVQTDIDSEPPSLSPPMSPVKSQIGMTSEQLSASTAKFDQEPSIRVNDSAIEDNPVDEIVASPAGVRKHLKAALVSSLYSRPADTKTRKYNNDISEEDIKPERCEVDELLNLALLCDPDDTNFDPFQITSIPTDEIVDAVVNEPTIEDTNAKSFDEEMMELAARETRDQYQLGRLQARIKQRSQITNPISPKQFTPSFKTLRSSRIKTTRTMLNQNQNQCNDSIANGTTNSTPELAVNSSSTIQSLQRGAALGPSMTSSSSGNKSVTSSSMISTHCDTAQRGKLYAKMMGLLNDVSPDDNYNDNVSNMKKTMINENKASGYSDAELKLIDEHTEEEMTRTLQEFEQNNSLVRSTPSTKAGTKGSEPEIGTILDFKIPELDEYQSDTIHEFTYQNHNTPSITSKFSDVTSPTVHEGFEEDEIILPPQQSPRVASSVTSPDGQALKVVTYLGGGQSSLKVKVLSSPPYNSPPTSPSTVVSLSPVAAAAAEAAVAEAVKYAMLQKLKRDAKANAKAKEEVPADANVTEITTVTNANAETDKLGTNIELNEITFVVKPSVDDLTSLFSPMQRSTSVTTRNQNDDDEQPLLEEEKVDVFSPIAAKCPNVMDKSDILGMMEQCKSLLVGQENTYGTTKVNNSNTKQEYFHESWDNGFDELQKVTSFLSQREDELMNKANNKKDNEDVDQPLFVVNFVVKSESLEGEMNDVRNFDDDILPNNQQTTFGCGVLDIWFSKFSK